MSKRHDSILDDVLSGLDAAGKPAEDRAGTRFFRRTNALAESGQREEKVLRWVDPADCVMWARHNRAYDLLTAENCADLIDSIRSQGRQEFPAIVRRLPDGQGAKYEVICGARRHFAISWLRANTYPNFRYLIEERDLTDEEAFRLADLENRDRQDISDYERAMDYAAAVDLYYGGKQSAMAERLEVSTAWLSRYLAMAKLPDAVVAAFASVRDIRESHARQILPLMKTDAARAQVIAAAKAMAGQGGDPAKVVSGLKAAVAAPRKPKFVQTKVYKRHPEERGMKMQRKGNIVTLEFAADMPDKALRAAVEQYLADPSRKG